MKLITQKIKNARETKNISQSWMAHKLGIHRSTYCEIENGNIELTVSRLFKILSLLDISPMDILPKNANDYTPPSLQRKT